MPAGQINFGANEQRYLVYSLRFTQFQVFVCFRGVQYRKLSVLYYVMT